MTIADLLVLGSGPAALALAGEAAAQGLAVRLVAPRPEAAWRQNFGGWADALDGTAAEGCVSCSWAAPLVLTPRRGERVLDRRYARISTPKLQAVLRSACAGNQVEIEAGSATAVEHGEAVSAVTLADGSVRQARVVVDATGTASAFLRRVGDHVPGYQVAYGQVLRVESHPWRCGEMVLMDWSSASGESGVGDEDQVPSFLYALPLGWDRIFVEETVLVGRPAASPWALAQRLERRLRRLGITPLEVEEEEFCTIAMGGPMPVVGQRTVGFGAAAGFVHPATGYSVSRSLQLAPVVARALAKGLETSPAAASAQAWQVMWPADRQRSWDLYRFGMDALCALDRDATGRFFDAFFDLPTPRWVGYQSATLSPGGVSRTMAEMFARADLSTQMRLAGFGARHPGTLLRAVVSP